MDQPNGLEKDNRNLSFKNHGETTEQIRQLINENPDISIAEIKRRVDRCGGTVDYHLRKLGIKPKLAGRPAYRPPSPIIPDLKPLDQALKTANEFLSGQIPDPLKSALAVTSLKVMVAEASKVIETLERTTQ